MNRVCDVKKRLIISLTYKSGLNWMEVETHQENRPDGVVYKYGGRYQQHDTAQQFITSSLGWSVI